VAVRRHLTKAARKENELPSLVCTFAAGLTADKMPAQVLWRQDYGHIRAALFLGKTVPAALQFLAAYIVADTP
jgi:hypothetical protein